MQTQYVEMTPELATKYLQRNTINRKVRQAEIRRLLAAIHSNEWTVSHQGIAIDVNGNLQDGQHRLMAIAQSGKTVPILVTTGVPVEAYKVIDQGAKRSASDVLNIPARTAAVVSIIANWYQSNAGNRNSPSLLVEIHEVFGDLIDELQAYAPGRIKLYASATMRAAAVVRIVSGADKQHVMDLYRALSSADVGSLPPIAKSLVSQVMRGEIGNYSSKGVTDTSARFWRVLDEKRKDSTKLIVINPKADMEAIFRAVRDHVEDTLGYLP